VRDPWGTPKALQDPEADGQEVADSPHGQGAEGLHWRVSCSGNKDVRGSTSVPPLCLDGISANLCHT
jgi:hypothetical protein